MEEEGGLEMEWSEELLIPVELLPSAPPTWLNPVSMT